MKFKSNRKRRSTRKTRQCKRIKNRRTRRQRGGLKMEEVFDEVIGEFTSCTKDEFRLSINSRFGSCENFNKLLKLRNRIMPHDLKTGVCNPVITDDQIRTREYLFTVQPDVKALQLQKIDTKWPEFVVHLKNVVESQYTTRTTQTIADIDRRLFDLKFTTSDAAAAAASSGAASSRAASSGAASSRSSSSGASSSGAETEKARRKQMIATLDRKLALISKYKGTTIKRPNFEALYDVSVDVFERIHKKHIEDYDKMISQFFEK